MESKQKDSSSETVERNLELQKSFDELLRLSQFIEDIGHELHWPNKITFALVLSLEELVTNVIKYGYLEKDYQSITPKITVYFECLPNQVKVVLEDNGISFNPLNLPEPDMTLMLEERPEGGLGIFLAKKKMDSLDYSRSEKFNRLTLRKNILP